MELEHKKAGREMKKRRSSALNEREVKRLSNHLPSEGEGGQGLGLIMGRIGEETGERVSEPCALPKIL